MKDLQNGISYGEGLTQVHALVFRGSTQFMFDILSCMNNMVKICDLELINKE